MHGGFDREYNHSGTRFLSLASSSVVSVRQLSSDRDRLGPSPRGYHSAVYVEEESSVYTFGGQRCSGGPYEFRADVHRLDLPSLSWEAVESTGQRPSPRSQCHAFVRDGSLFVYGGYDGHSILTDLHSLDLRTRLWRKVETEGAGPQGLRGLSPLDFHIYFCRPSGRSGPLGSLHDMIMMTYKGRMT